MGTNKKRWFFPVLKLRGKKKSIFPCNLGQCSGLSVAISSMPGWPVPARRTPMGQVFTLSQTLGKQTVHVGIRFRWARRRATPLLKPQVERGLLLGDRITPGWCLPRTGAGLCRPARHICMAVVEYCGAHLLKQTYTQECLCWEEIGWFGSIQAAKLYFWGTTLPSYWCLSRGWVSWVQRAGGAAGLKEEFCPGNSPSVTTISKFSVCFCLCLSLFLSLEKTDGILKDVSGSRHHYQVKSNPWGPHNHECEFMGCYRHHEFAQASKSD